MEAAPLAGELTATTFLEFTRTRAKGRRFRLLPKGNLTEADLATMGHRPTATLLTFLVVEGRAVSLYGEADVDSFRRGARYRRRYSRIHLASAAMTLAIPVPPSNNALQLTSGGSTAGASRPPSSMRRSQLNAVLGGRYTPRVGRPRMVKPRPSLTHLR